MMMPEPYVTAGLWTLAACVLAWFAVADSGPFNSGDDR